MTLRTCVLVHGGWHGGWHWDDVAARLRNAGADVHAPTLTGLAERAGEATARTDMSTHVADVVRVIDEHGLDDVVLVGHSYGGMVITGVAAERGDRLAELVYLDAFVPQDGQSVGDLLGPDFTAAARALAEAAGTPSLIPPMFPVEDTTGWSGERAAAIARRLTSHPIGTMEEPVRAPAEPAARRTFVYCNARPLGIVEPYASAARESPDWDYYELAGPHDAVRVMPATVAGLIESLAS
ncbi:alpha/beta fold hydrolase [Streptosporangium amethystogenes subsp. fukuiense]|uniref:Alpha/beta fold hydrolase n=1 Tax=Streptosporangium amethystogenes subsp. fukuiense TaxID=698418 RepID=A0ABW2SSS7_9ACTN